MVIGNKYLLNSAFSLKEALLKEADNTKYNRIILASAFLTEKAVDELKDFLDKVTANEIIFLIGTKQHFTSPNSIKKLLDISNTYSNIQIKLPLDPNFHIKCYYFSPLLKKSISNPLNFFFIGSGNLTESGLASQSELLIKVNDTETVNEVADYLEAIIKNSTDWNLEIKRYIEDYINKKVALINYQPFIPKRRDKSKTKRIKRILISNAARTIDAVGRASKDDEKFAMETYELLSKTNPNLNKNSWIVFSGLSIKEIEQLQKDYPVGSYFDREDGYDGSGWEIGVKRKICKVGAFYIDIESGCCVLFRINREVIPYKVTQEIINKAEEFGIKTEDDQDLLPTKDNMTKYIKFIKTQRKREI